MCLVILGKIRSGFLCLNSGTSITNDREVVMAHSFERRLMEYRKWLTTLETILRQRFGISVDDAFDERQLREQFNSGESPVDIAENIRLKRGLSDINSQKALQRHYPTLPYSS